MRDAPVGDLENRHGATFAPEPGYRIGPSVARHVSPVEPHC